MKVVSFGEILLRLTAPGHTKLFQKDSLDSSFCGSEANVAVSLSILGLESGFVTKLPDNDVGRAAVNSMRYFGVDTSQVIFGEGRMGLYYLENGASQRPSKVIYDRTYSAISLAKPTDFDWDRIFDGAGWFHWTGIDPALSDSLVDIIAEACVKAKERGITVSCDLNYRGKLWSPQKAQSIMPKLLKYVDICIANEEDSEKSLGLGTDGSDAEKNQIDKKSYVKIAETIHSLYGCKYIATTFRKSYSASMNGWSAVLYDAVKDKSYFSQNYDIQLVDRVGGGDSFAAGLIYAMITKMEDQDAIEFATAASCLKQTIEGDYNRTTVEDILGILKSGGNGRIQR